MTLLLEYPKTKFVQFMTELNQQVPSLNKARFRNHICTSNSIELTGYRQIEKDGQ